MLSREDGVIVIWHSLPDIRSFRHVLLSGHSSVKGTPEYATILAFDVKIDSDARKHADESGVRIFTADIIYHLFDQFTAHMDRLMEQRRQDARNLAVFPCIVKVSQLCKLICLSREVRLDTTDQGVAVQGYAGLSCVRFVFPGNVGVHLCVHLDGTSLHHVPFAVGVHMTCCDANIRAFSCPSWLMVVLSLRRRQSSKAGGCARR